LPKCYEVLTYYASSSLSHKSNGQPNFIEIGINCPTPRGFDNQETSGPIEVKQFLFDTLDENKKIDPREYLMMVDA
jgi:hypothetical protein